jgi:hypothetical protein
MPAFLMLVKKYALYIIIVIAVIVIYETGKSKGIAQLEAKQSELQLSLTKDSVKTLHSQLDSTSKLVTDSLSHIKAVVKYVAIKVDSSKYLAHIADSLHSIALVVDTSKSCKVITDAYNRRTAECELLRIAHDSDTVAIRVAQNTLVSVNQRLATSETMTTNLQSQLATIQKPYVCHIIFSIGCPSRTLMFFLGIGIVESIRIGVGKP